MSESDLPAERVRSRERLSALMDGEADRDQMMNSVAPEPENM